MTYIGEDPVPLYRVMQSRRNYKIVSRANRAMGEQANINLSTRRQRLYGKIDTDGDPIILLPNLGISEFRNSRVTALSFLVDATNALIEEYNSKIRQKPELLIPNLGSLVVSKQLTGYNEIALQRRKIVANFFVSYYGNLHGKHIANFEDFLEIFMRWAYENVEQEPVTNSGIIVSHSVPHSATGLVVEFGDYNENDDNLRASIVSHNSFPIYSNIAAKHGFYITRNSPWRLMANIESIRMQNYVDAYVIESYTGLPDFFDDFYIKAHVLDLRDIRTLLLATYNSFVHFNPVIKKPKICSDGSLKMTNHPRYKTSLEELDEIYDPPWWISRLYDIRCLEVGMKNRESNEKDAIYRKIESEFFAGGTTAALNYVNKAIKKKY